MPTITEQLAAIKARSEPIKSASNTKGWATFTESDDFLWAKLLEKWTLDKQFGPKPCLRMEVVDCGVGIYDKKEPVEVEVGDEVCVNCGAVELKNKYDALKIGQTYLIQLVGFEPTNKGNDKKLYEIHPA